MNPNRISKSSQLLPISPIQHHMISECISAPAGSGVYVEQVILDIHQEIDFNRFCRTWLDLVQHHEVFRLGFNKTADKFYQVITPLQELNIETNDWSHYIGDAADEFLSTFIQADRRLGFSPFSPPLFRISLLKLAKHRYTCIFSFFSAIADQKRLVFILKDLFAFYTKDQSPLSQSTQHPRSRIEPQGSPISTTDFWRTLFNGVKTPVTFPFDLAKPMAQEDRRKHQDTPLTTQAQTQVIPHDVTRRLAAFSKTYDIQLDFILMGAFALILSHYSGKNEIFFCIHRPARKTSLNSGSGNHTNMLPAKFLIDPEQNFPSFLYEVRKSWKETKSFEGTSLNDIRSHIRGKGGIELFDIAFSFHNRCIASAIEPNKDTIACKRISILSRMPFSLFLSICGTDELSVSFQYDRRRFNEKAILDISEHLVTLLAAVSEDGDSPLAGMPILTDQKKDGIMRLLNPTPMPQRPDLCLHHLFEIQASTNRDIEAVSAPNGKMTYGQLNDRANQISHYLISLGAVPGSRIMLLPEEDLTGIPAQLGILKTGGIVIPLSPSQLGNHPGQYFNTLLPDMVITSKKWSSRLPIRKEKIVVLETATKEIDRFPQTPPSVSVSPESVAYILNAPGKADDSTGVMIAHYALASYASSAIDIYDVLPTDRILLTAAYDTAAYATQVLLGLFSGANLTIAPWNSLPTPLVLTDFCKAQGVTVLELHINLWNRFVNEQDASLPNSIKLLIINDARPDAQMIKTWQPRIPKSTRTITTYGATETSGPAFWADLSDTVDREQALSQSPIGHAFPGVCVTLLNRFLQPALPNTVGEMYIGGAQVAQAYFNCGEKKRKDFREFVFLGKPIRFFKTGDYAKLTPDSGLVFLRPPGSDTGPNNESKAPVDFSRIKEEAGATDESLRPPIILVGNSVRAAQSYREADRSDHAFFHAPIFVHFYDADGQQLTHIDIPGIAKKCIKDIRKVHPDGPYILIGECQNAIVAHEMAVQFKGMGIEVPLLIVIDENWKAKGGENPSDVQQNFFKKQLSELKARGITYIFSKAKKRLYQEWVKAYTSMDGFREKLYKIAGLPVPEAIQYRTMEEIYYSACEKHPYSPPDYDGQVLLLYSENWKERFHPQLNRYYTGPVHKKSLPIGHSHWFKPEQVYLILEEVKQRA